MKSMSEVVRNWKRFHAHRNRVAWQEGCFGHQLRTDEYGMLSAKTHYIRQNPVSAGLRVSGRTPLDFLILAAASVEVGPTPPGSALKKWIGFSGDDAK